MNNKFPDVSKYQGDINFDVMWSMTDYIILKSGQHSWVDYKFERNRAECERVSLESSIQQTPHCAL